MIESLLQELTQEDRALRNGISKICQANLEAEAEQTMLQTLCRDYQSTTRTIITRIMMACLHD